MIWLLTAGMFSAGLLWQVTYRELRRVQADRDSWKRIALALDASLSESDPRFVSPSALL